MEWSNTSLKNPAKEFCSWASGESAFIEDTATLLRFSKLLATSCAIQLDIFCTAVLEACIRMSEASTFW
jgi:hypothetical protein